MVLLLLFIKLYEFVPNFAEYSSLIQSDAYWFVGFHGGDTPAVLYSLTLQTVIVVQSMLQLWNIGMHGGRGRRQLS